MRPKSLVLLLLALGCGLIAAIGVAQVLGSRESAPTAQPTGDTTEIVVATVPVVPGAVVNPEMLKMVAWPSNAVPPGAIMTVEAALDRQATAMIASGAPLYEQQLLPTGMRAGKAAPAIEQGFRSVPVRVDVVSGAASMIMPGDRVDVIVMVRAGRDFDQSRTRTIVQDVKVFAVDDLFNYQEVGTEKSIRAQTISLLLTPEQTEKIMMASEMGSIRLSLRNPEDREIADLQGIEPESLLGLDHSSNRDAEEGDGMTRDEMLAFLEEQARTRMAEGTPMNAGPPPNQFVMRVISGDQVEEIVLDMEMEETPMETTTAHDTASSGESFSVWQLFPSYGEGNMAEETMETSLVDPDAMDLPAPSSDSGPSDTDNTVGPDLGGSSSSTDERVDVEKMIEQLEYLSSDAAWGQEE